MVAVLVNAPAQVPAPLKSTVPALTRKPVTSEIGTVFALAIVSVPAPNFCKAKRPVATPPVAVNGVALKLILPPPVKTS